MAFGQNRSITLKGSDTRVILGQRWAEEFMSRNPGTTVQATGVGSGTGIAALINGTCDIAESSRPMKDSEKGQTQQKRGKDVIELPVALDAISTSMIEDLIFELKSPYTIIIATHNMQQAARISHFTAFLWPGELVENGETARLFTKPADKRTEDYITGRFG